jgi:D-glycero-alpha-D-manno-heptose-7-phosphate kinase
MTYPLAISRTPLRVSFFGGGTDLPGYYREHGGRVLSFAIDKYVYVAVKRGWTEELLLRCGGTVEQASSIDELSNGIVREALRITGQTCGLDVVSLSDIPSSGTGLGSSSAFTVGLLHAIFAYRGQARSATDLAELACHIEIDLLREPIGKQDQYASAVGGCKEYVFHTDGSVTVEPVDLSQDCVEALSQHALLFYTGRTRRAADILTNQRDRIGATQDDLHLLKEIVSDGRRCLLESDIPSLGKLLHASWETKKRLSDRIHDDSINSLYFEARKAGAYGGKLLGAGGGGFLLFLCPPDRHDAVRAAMAGLREMPFRLGVPGTTILVATGTAQSQQSLRDPADLARI